MPILTAILNALFSFLGILVKNPFVIKMAIFSLFVGLVLAALSFLFGLVTPYVVNLPILGIAYALGIMDALKLYFSIIIAGFGVKQVVGFVKATG
jgi:hypothetical protein